MPRYFFHTQDGRCVLDESGTELPDEGAARRAAVRFLAEMIRDDGCRLFEDGAFRVICTDEAANRLFVVGAAIEQDGRQAAA